MNKLSVILSVSISLLLAIFTLSPILIYYYYTRDIDEPIYTIIVSDSDEMQMTPEDIELLPTMKEELVTNIILSLLTGIVSGISLSIWITGPLRRLAKKIGSNDFSMGEQIEPSGTQEVKLLAKEFNRLSAAVKDKENFQKRLLTDISHELLTPLSVIEGNLHAILDGVYPLEREEIARIYNQSKHLSALVNELQQLSHAEAGTIELNIQQVNTGDVLKELYDLFKPMAEEENINLKLDTTSSAIVMVDPMRLRQILSNLISNAFRHTPEGGSVLLETDSSNCLHEIRVHDNGSGFPPENAQLLFKRFYSDNRTLQRDRAGSGGLGLAISRALAEMQDGSLTAKSSGPGMGSVFTLKLHSVSVRS